MTKETPPDWVLIEAAKRGNMLHWGLEQLRTIYKTGCIFTALCDMIEKYEKPPVDRKVLCAREALTEASTDHADVMWTDEDVAVRAIELWEEGFGK
jgi:hypothetical protein